MAAERSAVPARRTLSALVLLSLLTLPVPAARAQGAATAAPPGKRLELGFEERIRNENWDDITDFNHSTVDARHQTRFRTRAWGKLGFGSRAELLVGLNNENRKVTTPETPHSWDEVIFETLYLDYRFNDAFAARLGRQDLSRGDRNLIFDGGPLDGSRTGYFNALDATWTFGKSKLELIGVLDPWHDEYLPIINDQDRRLIEYDEKALGLYFTNTGRERTNLQGYYFFKSETGDFRDPASAAWQGDLTVHTLGGRAARDWESGWSAALEMAGQLGTEEPDRDLRAWAAFGWVKYGLEQPWKPSLQLDLVALSGDDPETRDREGWDPLLGRWPRWSEAYIYTLGSERGGAYWTNYSLQRATFQVLPAKGLDVRVSYSSVQAFHRYPGKPSIYAGGDGRGQWFIGRADYKLNDTWRGHVTGEWLIPGRFYTGTDSGWFFRVEVICTLRKVFSLD